jgi:hypothetical protein
MAAGLDDTFPIDLTAKNVSSAPASQDELWLQLPPDCIYAAQPAGFAGYNGTVLRHGTGRLDPKVTKVRQEFDITVTFQTTDIAIVPLNFLDGTQLSDVRQSVVTSSWVGRFQGVNVLRE